MATSDATLISTTLTDAIALNELIHHKEDHVIVLDLGDADRVELRVTSLGKTYEPVVREPIIV